MKITDLSIQSKDIQIKTLSDRETTKIIGGNSNSVVGTPGTGGILVPPCNGGWPWWPVPAPSGGNNY